MEQLVGAPLQLILQRLHGHPAVIPSSVLPSCQHNSPKNSKLILFGRTADQNLFYDSILFVNGLRFHLKNLEGASARLASDAHLSLTAFYLKFA